jgi:hypothetical protein
MRMLIRERLDKRFDLGDGLPDADLRPLKNYNGPDFRAIFFIKRRTYVSDLTRHDGMERPRGCMELEHFHLTTPPSSE